MAHIDHTMEKWPARLQQAFELLESITGGTDGLAAALDTHLRVIAFNAAYGRTFHAIFGANLDFGTDMVDALERLPTQGVKMLHIWRRVLGGESFAVTETFGESAAEGKSLEIRCTPLRNPGGVIIGAAQFAWDVSERIRSEADLRESRSRFQTFMDHTPALAWMKDENGRYVYINRSFERRHGMSMAEVLGKTDFELFPAEAAQQFRDNDLSALACARAIEFVETIPGPEGSSSWLIQKFPFQDSVGRRYVGGTGVEITERLRMEKALRESEEVLALAVEATGLGVFDFYPRTGKLVLSDTAKNHFGLPTEAPVDYDVFLSRLHPDDRERVHGMVQQVLHHESGGGYSTEYRTLSDDGRGRWLSARGKVIFDAQRQPVRFIGATVDITAAKEMEESLRESEERFRSTFEQAAVGIAHIGLDGRFLRLNRKFSEIAGYPQAELLKKTFMEISFPDEFPADLDQTGRLLRGEIDHFQMEKRYRHGDGHLIWVHLTRALQRNPDGTPRFYITVIEDISARKAMEDELVVAREKAEDANRAKSEFLANMSHELRTPMTVILGSLELLQSNQDLPERSHLLDMTDNAAHRLLGIIDDLLDISKIEARQMKIEKVPFDLWDCILSSLEIFDRSAKEKGLDFYCKLSPGLRRRVHGDPARLGQVLANLVGNPSNSPGRGKSKWK